MLPIVHSTAEELAAMIWHKTIEAFGVDILKQRGITAIEIAVAEAPMQEAGYRRKRLARARVVCFRPRRRGSRRGAPHGPSVRSIDASRFRQSFAVVTSASAD